jgi:hypothetical protein
MIRAGRAFKEPKDCIELLLEFALDRTGSGRVCLTDTNVFANTIVQLTLSLMSGLIGTMERAGTANAVSKLAPDSYRPEGVFE